MNLSTWQASVLNAIVLFFGLWNFIRGLMALLNREALLEYGAPASYLLASAIAWLLAALGLLAAMLVNWRHTRRAGIAVSVLYWVWYWVDRLFIQPSPAPNLVFSAVFSTVALLATLLLWLAPATKDFSEEERE
jgi:hypothetical protein